MFHELLNFYRTTVSLNQKCCVKFLTLLSLIYFILCHDSTWKEAGVIETYGNQNKQYSNFTWKEYSLGMNELNEKLFLPNRSVFKHQIFSQKKALSFLSCNRSTWMDYHLSTPRYYRTSLLLTHWKDQSICVPCPLFWRNKKIHNWFSPHWSCWKLLSHQQWCLVVGTLK